MKTIQPYARFIALILAAFVIAGCANKMAPAQKAIADIETAVTAAGEDATKYVPDQVQAVNDQLANLKAMFDKKDYKGVLAAAPAVLTQAQGLTAAAAAKKTETMDMYAGEWTNLASSVPQAVAAIQSRVDILSKSKKLPAGMDAATLDNVKTSLAEANSTWAQATQAQAAGDLEQAVTLAQQVKTRTDELLTTLGMTAG
jgi:PBP1b-binding outer membrane lipoprotein LpoB